MSYCPECARLDRDLAVPPRTPGDASSGLICNNCGKRGHLVRDCALSFRWEDVPPTGHAMRLRARLREAESQIAALKAENARLRAVVSNVSAVVDAWRTLTTEEPAP